jgi:arylsulfatase A-like enzyme
VKRHYGIRNDQYKLIHFYHDIDAWELYDLKSDPSEMNNLIEDPGYKELILSLKAELKELQIQYQDTISN